MPKAALMASIFSRMETHSLYTATGEKLCRILVPGRTLPAIEVRTTDSDTAPILMALRFLKTVNNADILAMDKCCLDSLLLTWEIASEKDAAFYDKEAEHRVILVKAFAEAHDVPSPDAWMILSITTQSGNTFRSSFLPMTHVPDYPDAFCMNLLGTIGEEIEHLTKPFEKVRKQIAKESGRQDLIPTLKIRFRDVVFYRYFKLAFAHMGVNIIAQTDNVADKDRAEFAKGNLPAICASADCNKMSTNHQKCAGCKVSASCLGNTKLACVHC